MSAQPLKAHTPGPWFWEVTPSGEVRLCTPDRGRLYVMGFARHGMRGAQPRFSLWGEGERGRRGGIMHDFAEAGGANHPDAKLIAASPGLLAMVERYAAECGECGGTGLLPEIPQHIDRPCPACADIRVLIHHAGGAA